MLDIVLQLRAYFARFALCLILLTARSVPASKRTLRMRQRPTISYAQGEAIRWAVRFSTAKDLAGRAYRRNKRAGQMRAVRNSKARRGKTAAERYKA